jgi:hypothetical protein
VCVCVCVCVNDGLEIREYDRGDIRCAEHATSSIRKSWHLLHRQAAVARLVEFAAGLRRRSLVLYVSHCKKTGNPCVPFLQHSNNLRLRRKISLRFYTNLITVDMRLEIPLDNREILYESFTQLLQDIGQKVCFGDPCCCRDLRGMPLFPLTLAGGL